LRLLRRCRRFGLGLLLLGTHECHAGFKLSLFHRALAPGISLRVYRLHHAHDGRLRRRWLRTPELWGLLGLDLVVGRAHAIKRPGGHSTTIDGIVEA
jgi:hypothetical protein